jgi:hypothetical protein
MSDDKPTAILTNAQRKYLQGEKEYRPSVERQVQRRIRERIEQGIADFTTIFHKLDQEEVRKIFGSNTAQPIKDYEEALCDTHAPPTTTTSVPMAMAFFLRGLNYSEEPIHKGLDEIGEQQPAFNQFVDSVETGVSQYLKEETPYMANVKVSIELENVKHQDEFLESLKED